MGWMSSSSSLLDLTPCCGKLACMLRAPCAWSSSRHSDSRQTAHSPGCWCCCCLVPRSRLEEISCQFSFTYYELLGQASPGAMDKLAHLYLEHSVRPHAPLLHMLSVTAVRHAFGTPLHEHAVVSSVRCVLLHYQLAYLYLDHSVSLHVHGCNMHGCCMCLATPCMSMLVCREQHEAQTTAVPQASPDALDKLAHLYLKHSVRPHARLLLVRLC
jgi:hypothetical protein